MSYITEKTRDLLTFAREQDASMLTESKALAVAIASAADPSVAAQELFDVVRGAYAFEKTLGHKRETSEIGKAWNRIKAAMRHHLKEDSLSVSFPDIRTGEGSAVVQTVSEAKDERVARKEEQDRRDADARAAHIAAQTEQQVKAIREMGVSEVTSAMLAIFKAWDVDRAESERSVVLTMLTDAIMPKAKLPAVPELVAAAPVAKPARVKKAA